MGEGATALEGVDLLYWLASLPLHRNVYPLQYLSWILYFRTLSRCVLTGIMSVSHPFRVLVNVLGEVDQQRGVRCRATCVV